MRAGARRGCLGRGTVFLVLAGASVLSQAAADPWADTCLVRPEAPPPPGQTMSPPAPAQSSLGWRRTRTRLFDVSLTVVGSNSVCAVSGVARLRSGPDGETLVLPVRPEAAASRSVAASPCLLTLRATATAIELATSDACRAQPVCGGQVVLQGLDHVLMATGRKPNTRGLGCEEVSNAT